MSYLGKTQLKASDVKRFDVTSSTSATHLLTWTTPNEQSLFVTINGVKQQEDAYSIAGSPTTVTLTSALVSSDKLEIIGIVDIGETTVPGSNTVDTASIQAKAVTQPKLWVSGTGEYYYHPNTVSTTMTTTVDSANNGVMFGPITVDSGVAWTISGVLSII